jgi:hypothetical protein
MKLTYQADVCPGGRSLAVGPANSRASRNGRPILLSLIASSLLALPAALHAQAAPAASAAASSEVVRLNPFEVLDEKDGSFTTTAVGTGSRLKLDLADVPAAYSVINREFIDALGINDLQEAATWAPGQTFLIDTSGGSQFGEQGSFTSRGFRTNAGGSNVNFSSGNGNQRNFYQNSTANGDSFSVETYDFGRGPNSSLFGSASGASGSTASAGSGLAGVASVQTKKARLDRATGSVAVEIGNWGYHRETLDYNRPITDRFGVRLSLVDLEQTAYLKQNLKTTRGIHITTTWKITPSTTLTVEGANEKTKTHNTAVDINEAVSGWDGQTVFRGPVLNAFYSTNATAGVTSAASSAYGTIQLLGGSALTFNGEPSGVDRVNGTAYYYDAVTGTVMNYRNAAISRKADATSRVPLWSASAPNGASFVRGTNNGGNGPTGTSVAFGVNTNPTWFNMNGIPRDMYDRAVRNSRFVVPARRDNWALNQPQTVQFSPDLQFALDHSFSSNLYASLGGDINRNHSFTRNDSSLKSPRLDLAQILPDGSPNPHYLDSYAVEALRIQDQWTGDQAIRGNVLYTLNTGKWGNYTFNLNLNANTRHYVGNSHTTTLAQNADIRRWSATDVVSIMSYFSDKARGWKDGTNNGPLTFTEVVWDTNNSTPVIQAPTKVTPRTVLRGVQDEATTDYLTQYFLLQTTGSWFQNKVVGVGAVRRDYAKSMRVVGVRQGDLPANWDGQTSIFKPKWQGAQRAYYLMTYQPVDANGNAVGQRRIATARPTTTDANGLAIRNPLYSNQQFQDDFSPPVNRTYQNTYTAGLTLHPIKAISPFINFSNQAIPPDFASADMLGNQKLAQVAKGVDFGTQFSLFNGKLTGKYNYYYNTRTNDPANNGVINQINSLINTRRFDDAVAGSTNARGVAPLGGVTANNPAVDYTMTRNFGYEIELTGQIGGLRLTANGTAGSTGVNNADRFPLTKKYMSDPANLATFKQLLEDAGGSLDTTQKPVDAGNSISYAPGLAINTPIAGNANGLDTTAAVNAYNNIWIQYNQIIILNTVTRTRRQPSVNFFADYAIQSGKLKGLRMGAGIQWQGARNVGNKGSYTVLDPANPIPTAIDDPSVNVNDILWATGAYNTQANLSYTFRLKNGNSLALALRVNNFLDNRKITANYVLRQPNGDLTKPNRILLPAGANRLPDPINARLTTTYSFGGGRTGGR